jgi:hypothetical protein
LVVGGGGSQRIYFDLEGVAPGSEIAVKAMTREGVAGWDWARLIVAP